VDEGIEAKGWRKDRQGTERACLTRKVQAQAARMRGNPATGEQIKFRTSKGIVHRDEARRPLERNILAIAWPVVARSCDCCNGIWITVLLTKNESPRQLSVGDYATENLSNLVLLLLAEPRQTGVAYYVRSAQFTDPSRHVRVCDPDPHATERQNQPSSRPPWSLLAFGLIGAIIDATLGAIVLLLIIRSDRGGGRWH
jgi:hypothetical protein